MVATDGKKLTLGDTTLTLYITPGHTARDDLDADSGEGRRPPARGGRLGRHDVQFRRGRGRPSTRYIASAERFQGIVARAGADTVISNHTNYDGTKTKIPALATRKPGEPHPYVIGNDAVKRYLTVAKECAAAAQAALP